jgi:hypothetical protein
MLRCAGGIDKHRHVNSRVARVYAGTCTVLQRMLTIHSHDVEDVLAALSERGGALLALRALQQARPVVAMIAPKRYVGVCTAAASRHVACQGCYLSQEKISVSLGKPMHLVLPTLCRSQRRPRRALVAVHQLCVCVCVCVCGCVCVCVCLCVFFKHVRHLLVLPHNLWRLWSKQGQDFHDLTH